MEINRKSIDLPPFHRPNGKDRAAGDHPVAGLRNASEDAKNKSTDRRRLFVRNLESETVVQLADVGAARDERFTRAGLNRFFLIFRRVVLIEYLADDLFEQILHRHDTGRSTVLVENDSHVLFQSLEVRENVFNFARSGNHMDGPDQLAKREPR